MTHIDNKYLALTQCSITSNNPSLSGDENEYSRVTTKKLFSQKFELELTTTRINDTELANELDVLLASMNGSHGIFTVYNPRWFELRSLETATVVTRTDCAQLVNAIPCEQFTPNIQGAFKVGAYIQFDNHPKVYRVTNIVNANGSGQGTVYIFPYLYKAVPAGTELIYNENVKFQLSLTTDQQMTDISTNDRAIQMLIPCRERA